MRISAILTGLAFLSLLWGYLAGTSSGVELAGDLLFGIPFSFLVFFLLGLPIALVERELFKRFSRRAVFLGCALSGVLACILFSLLAGLLASPR